jgi:hypothetical protein
MRVFLRPNSTIIKWGHARSSFHFIADVGADLRPLITPPIKYRPASAHQPGNSSSQHRRERGYKNNSNNDVPMTTLAGTLSKCIALQGTGQ